MTRKNWILWLSGPAGAGKTTIGRTLAYLCDERGVDQASFFFCKMDLTRSDIKPLVATLACQIACRFPAAKDIAVAEIEQRPFIFGLSVKEQFRCLVIKPLTEGGWTQGAAGNRPHPIVCFIDALDECQGRHALDVQSNVIHTLHDLVSGANSPVTFILASRPEPNLRMSFNRIRHSVSRIYLDNTYHPSVDIRRFVVDKFEDIRVIHPLASLLLPDWPKTSVVDAIVAKSSGQFMYAATVMQHIASPCLDPSASLDDISRVSTASSIMPFIEMDRLFTCILERTTSLAVVLTAISCHLLSRELSFVWFSLLIELHGHSIKSIQRDIINMASLVNIDDKHQRLTIYNESFVDFLLNPVRSGRFCIDLGLAAYNTLMIILRQRTRDDVHLVVDYLIALMPKVTNHSEEMENHLLAFSREAVTVHPEPFLTLHGSRILLDAFSNPVINLQIRSTCRCIWKEWSVEDQHLLSPEQIPFEVSPMSCAIPMSRIVDLQPMSPTSTSSQSDLEDILASVLISKATSISIGTVAYLLGHNAVDCARVASYPLMMEYNSEEDSVTFRDEYSKLGLRPNLHTFKIQAVIRILSLGDSYKGNLFGDLSALLFVINAPTTALTSQFKEFATLLLSSPPVDVHVLDFTTFLDGLAHVYCEINRDRFKFSFSPTNPHAEMQESPEYIEILTHFVRFWASKNNRLDPLLLSVPQLGDIWQTIV